MDSIMEAFGVPSGLWGLAETIYLVISELREVHWGEVSAVWKAESSEVRKSWIQILILSIHSYLTLGKFYLNFLCLSFLIHEMEAIMPTSQCYYEG